MFTDEEKEFIRCRHTYNDLKRKSEDLVVLIREKESTLNKILNEISETKKKAEIKKKNVDFFINECERLKIERSSELEKIQSQVDNYIRERKVLESNLADMKKEYDKTEDEINVVQRVKDDLHFSVTLLRKDIDNKDKNIAFLNEKIVRLQSDKVIEKECLDKLKREKVHVIKQLEGMKNELEGHKNQLMETKLEKKKLDDEIHLKEQNLLKIEHNIGDSLKKMSTYNSDITNAENTLRILNENIEKKNHILLQRKNQINELNNKLESIETDIRQKGKQLNIIENNLEERNQRYQDASSKYDEIQSKVQLKYEELRNTSEKVTINENYITQLEERALLLKRILNEKEDDIMKVIETISDKKSQLHELEHEMNSRVGGSGSHTFDISNVDDLVFDNKCDREEPTKSN